MAEQQNRDPDEYGPTTQTMEHFSGFHVREINVY